MTLAVMGCVVNGPGESKAANIGISLPGTGEAPSCPVFIDGEHVDDAARHATTSSRRNFSVSWMTTSSTPTHDADPPSLGAAASGVGAAGRSSASDALLRDALHRVWGFSEFRPLQREAMHAILRVARQRRRAADRRRQVALLPGAGGRGAAASALVVSPLISLMKDQVDGLRVDGVDGVVPQQHAAAARARRGDRERARRPLPPALRVARAAGRRRRAVAAAAAASRRTCSSSPSTRRTASASGATISARSTASSDGCARIFPACRSTRSPRRRPSASAATSSHELRLREPLVLVGSFDRPNLVYRVLRRGTSAHAADQHPRSPRRRVGHRLLLVAQGSGGAGRVAEGRGAQRRAVPRRAVRRGAQPPPGDVPRRARRTSSSRRWRSGWASIDRTCASSCTPARRGRSSTTSRSRAAPAATACRPSAC